MHKNTVLAASALTLLASPALTHAQCKAEFEALKKQVAALEQRLDETEGRTESSAASKLKLTDSLTELKLSGDLRLRYRWTSI